MPSKMTKEERAAYQREYRRRQRREQVMNTTEPAKAVRDLIDCQDEVTRLKRELAARPANYTLTTDGASVTITPPPTKGSRVEIGRFGSSHPAPKPGKNVR